MIWRRLSWGSKMSVVLTLCGLLFLVNATWLAWVQRHGAELHSSPFYPTYVEIRSVLLQPFSLLATALFLVFGFFFVAKPHVKPANEVEEIVRLAALAMLTCAALGVVLTSLFKL
jgi:hypothetical protein